MLKNNPARLQKKEPITLEYDKQAVYIMGTLFTVGLVALAFFIGSESLSYLLWSCI